MKADSMASALSWQDETRKAWRLGVSGTLMGGIALGAWVALAPISAAVIAEGTVKSKGNRKTVQHAEGGIVAVIHVKDGDPVVQGQPLITLADERVAASAHALRDQAAAGAIKMQRLEAETSGRDFTPDLSALEEFGGFAATPRATELTRREKEVFTARSLQQSEQSRWLAEQLTQTRQEIASQRELINTTEEAFKLAQRDLEANQRLKIAGFVSEAKLAEIQRISADYRARVQAVQGQLAQARQKEADIRLRLAAQKTEFARGAADELKDVAAQLALTRQQLRPALDAQQRQIIVAPVAGEVVDLKVHTIGASIGPREPLLDIVPADSSLVVEARIAPADIRDMQQVLTDDGVAHVMLTAYRARATPLVKGTLTYVGADRLVDMRSSTPGVPYYIAHIAVGQEALDAASETAGQRLVLSPGMQVEAITPTVERSAWRYLFDPVLDGVRHSLRER